jgi:hypothetical protein
MLQSEREKLLTLEQELHKRVVGQEEAISALSNAIRRSRAGLQDPKKPIGSFIFLGTTGVGKTEVAKALAEFLFNTDNAMVRIDMSEYQEKHTVSRLVGAPPGYVGYDEGGQLTEAIRRRPYSVVLLDEIEKAHPDVFNILLQVLDDGRLTDNKGRTANFRNTIIIMTSNLGSEVIREKFEHIETGDRDAIVASAKSEVFDMLKRSIRPEFLNRIDEVVMFEPLGRDEIHRIVELQIDMIVDRLKDNGIELTVTRDAVSGFDVRQAGGLQGDHRAVVALLVLVLGGRELLGHVSRDGFGGVVAQASCVLLQRGAEGERFGCVAVRHPGFVPRVDVGVVGGGHLVLAVIRGLVLGLRGCAQRCLTRGLALLLGLGGGGDGVRVVIQGAHGGAGLAWGGGVRGGHGRFLVGLCGSARDAP